MRTRELLVDAVIRLLRASGTDSRALTISDITAAAGLSRPTFYQHYADPDELIAVAVRHTLRSRLRTGLGSEPAGPTPPRTLVDLLGELNRHRWLYGRLVAGNGQFGRGREEVVTQLADDFSALTPDRDTCLFLAGGLLGMLGPWMASADPAPQSEVDRIAGRLWELIRRTAATP